MFCGQHRHNQINAIHDETQKNRQFKNLKTHFYSFLHNDTAFSTSVHQVSPDQVMYLRVFVSVILDQYVHVKISNRSHGSVYATATSDLETA